ncbi:MAG: hypothetical protein N2508_08830 [Anaerolineae bacterium]|nr:hypothetical protein [Anaerolineae bacterium]
MNLRTRIMILGGVLGALLGVGVAYLYLKSIPIQVDEKGQEILPPVQPSKALAAALGVLTAVKQIIGMGRP